jgi:hypothetical protein
MFAKAEAACEITRIEIAHETPETRRKMSRTFCAELFVSFPVFVDPKNSRDRVQASWARPTEGLWLQRLLSALAALGVTVFSRS